MTLSVAAELAGRFAPLGLAVGLYLLCLRAEAQVLPFDGETLRLRGIDPQLAQFLSERPQFTEGQHSVDLSVNGQPRGRVLARFDGRGALCFDPPLIQAANLLAPKAIGCAAFIDEYPQTRVELLPQRGEVALLVPGQALQPMAADLSGFTLGGVAGVLNYDLQALYNQYDGSTGRFWSANTEAGFNAGDWIVRSRQLSSSSNGLTRTEHLEAYAQKTFIQYQAQFQAGQINLYNPVLSGAQIVGAQWMSEPALSSPAGRGLIEGIAATQARVEVYQGGVLRYATVVPAGPFALSSVAQLDPRRDAQVTVIEADGTRRTFTVLAATLGLELPASGFAFAAGQVRDVGGLSRAPWVLSAGWSQPLLRTASLSSGLLASDGYRAGGAGLAFAPWRGARLQGLVQVAHALQQDELGVQGSMSLGQQLSEFWSANLTLAQQGPGYRELSDTLFDPHSGATGSRYRQQYAAALGWSHPWLGNLSSGYSASNLYDGRQSERAFAAWGRRIGRASLSVNAEWNVNGDAGLGDAVYLAVSLPLGERRRMRATLRTAGGQSRAGLGMQEQVSETFAYRLGAERAAHQDNIDLNAGASVLSSAAQWDAGYASYGGGNAGYSATVRGGLALHEGGVTLSAYPLQDTFALLSLGEVPGVRVDTSAGVVWTDRRGEAVVAQVAPYGKSSVEVASRSLPRNVDIQQGAAVIQAGRGAVPRLAFATRITRRVLLQGVGASGELLPAGALVSDQDGRFVTLVQEGGSVFVANVVDSPLLFVKTPGQPTCALQFQLPDKADPQRYFETADAQCLPH